MPVVEAGQIWLVTHPEWPDRYIRILSIRGGIAHSSRCTKDGGRHARPVTSRIPIEDLSTGKSRAMGTVYSLIHTEARNEP